MASPLLDRAAGVLLHPTSLPGPGGIGDLGASARRFVDWLQASAVGVWQILPLVPAGPGHSPYSTCSALAGDPLLLDLEALAADGLLDPDDLDHPRYPLDYVDFDAVVPARRALIEKAADRFCERDEGALEAFLAREPWARETALFLALKEAHDGAPWWAWASDLAACDADALERARREHAPRIARLAAQQLLFDAQWRDLRAYANARAVKVLGDVPIYVDRDSVDVWSNQSQFRLDASGAPLAVAGVPPDFFSALGQLWGNPLYDWERMAADGHRWWVERLRRACALTDLVRIDHFRGFSAFWEVPAGAADARGGRWVKGPGEALFDDLRAALGALPIVAEDLGVIDDDVVHLRDAIGVPGMRVLQFAFGEGADHPFLPHNYPADCVAYTATHDNDTTSGWWQQTDDRTRDHVRRYLAVPGHDIVWDMIRCVLASVARLAIIPLQDVLVLDSGARMNTPGTAEGNWGWRVREQAFNSHLASRLAELNHLYGRAPATHAG